MTEGKKYDQGKLDLSLLDYDLIEPLIEVLALGEARYGYENWKNDFGPNWRRRFRAAMRRHDFASAKDSLARNTNDGCVYHLAQVAINALFELYHARAQQPGERTVSTEQEVVYAPKHIRKAMEDTFNESQS